MPSPVFPFAVKRKNVISLPAEVRLAIVAVVLKLVTFVVGHNHQRDADSHGREDKYQDSAAQRLDHPRSG